MGKPIEVGVERLYDRKSGLGGINQPTNEMRAAF